MTENANAYRIEHDSLGDMQVPADALYGVQTVRAIENFKITGQHLDHDLIVALAQVKKAAAMANMHTGRMATKVEEALVKACDEVIAGKHDDQFPIDPIQGGAGTSINMNINEVITNRALELVGMEKGRYDIISPNNDANMGQSTNDAFPTAIKVCLSAKSKKVIAALERLAAGLDAKAEEFKHVMKMGRTHLQDAVPITLGQEMASYASAVRRGIYRISLAVESVHVMNMGGTAIGTGLNAEPEYITGVAARLSQVTGETYRTAANMIDATNNTDCFADISAALRNTALVLIKMANDFRLMASGPRCGLSELKLPMRQPGSSIMPGKVNPVIAEVLDQTCYQIIGNDLAVTLAVENGQFELNVMEPVMAFNMFNSMNYLANAVDTFNEKLLKDLEPNVEQCSYWLNRSVGVITALLPHIGYEAAANLAKEAYKTGLPIRDIVLDKGHMTPEEVDCVLSPEQMTTPGIARKSKN